MWGYFERETARERPEMPAPIMAIEMGCCIMVMAVMGMMNVRVSVNESFWYREICIGG